MRRGLVISNCQIQPIKHMMSMYSDDIVFDGFGVHLLPHDNKDHINNLVSNIDKYDVVLTVPLSDQYEEISSEKIGNYVKSTKLVRIANMYFSGLHPDLTYIGGLSKRVDGPLGDYHSKLALLAYLRGYNVAEAFRLYTEKVYKIIGYFDVAEKSIEELKLREQNIDVQFSDILQENYREHPTFFSVNHPTSFMFDLYCQRISAWLEHNLDIKQSGFHKGALFSMNYLAGSAIFPVYPEISMHLNLKYPGSYNFKPGTVGDDPVSTYNLYQMISREFDAFDAVGRDDLGSSHQGRLVLHDYGTIDFLSLI
ncbi:hypothetical protein MPEAHAMD_2973 [Methylobacterium frigidaeris]|uniref:Polysaccharide biosynthesis enzyme WcbI domain-containing protein n=4 Tax=Methylobacterium frigidaeris TaxID=2038277 RepID=A0AA37M509_9HYPH|nr:hypothetical protein MPEAHAMD_2973 [Methylobacterium frigidaeris]